MRAPRDSPDAPDLPPQLEPRQLDGLSDGDQLEGVAVRDARLPETRARQVVVQAATLDGVDLSGARLDGLSLVDARVTGGSLANVTARTTRGVRAEVIGARVTGMTLTGCDLRDVLFRGCRVDLASFGHGRLDRVWFEDCVLTEADFASATLREVRFLDCDLGGADFRGARMTGCAMRGVRLEGLVGVERLRGTALPWPDIVENTATWAAALGLRVLE